MNTAQEAITQIAQKRRPSQAPNGERRAAFSRIPWFGDHAPQPKAARRKATREAESTRSVRPRPKETTRVLRLDSEDWHEAPTLWDFSQEAITITDPAEGALADVQVVDTITLSSGGPPAGLDPGAAAISGFGFWSDADQNWVTAALLGAGAFTAFLALLV